MEGFSALGPRHRVRRIFTRRRLMPATQAAESWGDAASCVFREDASLMAVSSDQSFKEPRG